MYSGLGSTVSSHPYSYTLTQVLIQFKVTEALSISATKCTVVALYRRLVVGAAFLSSPEETYITYLVVRPGWESAGIATYVSLSAWMSAFSYSDPM